MAASPAFRLAYIVPTRIARREYARISHAPTRLHYTLADQKGLAYSIHAAIEPLADAALFEIAGATANAKVPQLVKELLSLLDGLRRGELTNDELAKARVRYRYETLASLDDASTMAGCVWTSPTRGSG